MCKRYMFTIDDNIRLFRELSEKNPQSIFEQRYLALLKKLHEKWGVKVQLNCFLEDMNGFHLSQMPSRYKAEWEANADWLKLSFHSKKEFPIEPYKASKYAELYNDSTAVHREIERFAGKRSLAKTTTVHYCLATAEGVNALKDCGIKGLLGLYGTDMQPQNSYDCTLEESKRIRQGEIVEKDGVYHTAIDVVLNMYNSKEIIGLLETLKGKKTVEIMIHEQFFYSDYAYYAGDFQELIETAVEYLMANGYESIFFEELL